MHSIFALQESSQRGIGEVVLHFQQVDKLGHPSALLHYVLQVRVWIFDKLVDSILVCEYAILLIVFEHTKVGLTWHQKTFLHDVNQAKT